MEKEIKNILIVDDEVDICYLIRSVLKRKADANIDICNSVAQATAQLLEKSYDLAFFDMRLNDGSGEDLINFVQESIVVPPYIAVISAYASQSDLDRLSALNINEFIPKPLSSQEIINCYLSASE